MINWGEYWRVLFGMRELLWRLDLGVLDISYKDEWQAQVLADEIRRKRGEKY